MQKKMPYKLIYTVLFTRDVISIINYISYNLQNAVAASNFTKDMTVAIANRSKCPDSFEPYFSTIDRTYYRIYIKNYTLYYYLISDRMILYRILYGKRQAKMFL